jgi:hypothetical protein
VAQRLTSTGLKVTIVGRKLFGGTCVNTGYIRTKTMMARVDAAYMARRAADFGVMMDYGVSVDMRRVKETKDVNSHRRGACGCAEGRRRHPPALGRLLTAIIAPDGSILGQPIRSGESEVHERAAHPVPGSERSSEDFLTEVAQPWAIEMPTIEVQVRRFSVVSSFWLNFSL